MLLFYFALTIRPKEASDSDFTIGDVMLWPGMRFSLRSQCKRCCAGRLQYKRETEILKQKRTEAKLSHGDACKAHRIARSPPVPNMVSQSAFPPLQKKTLRTDRTQARSIVGVTPFPHAAGVSLDQDEMIITEQLDFSSLFLGNPLTFLAF